MASSDFLAAVFVAGLLFGVGDGFGRAAGILAHGVEVAAQRGHEGGRDDLVVLDLRQNRRVAVDDAVNGVGAADFGELMFVEQAVVFGGFAVRRGRRGGCWVSHRF